MTDVLLAIQFLRDRNVTEMTEFLPQKQQSYYTSNAPELYTRSDKTEAHCVNAANAIERGCQNVKVRTRKGPYTLTSFLVPPYQ